MVPLDNNNNMIRQSDDDLSSSDLYDKGKTIPKEISEQIKRPPLGRRRYNDPPSKKDKSTARSAGHRFQQQERDDRNEECFKTDDTPYRSTIHSDDALSNQAKSHATSLESRNESDQPSILSISESDSS